MSFNVSIDYFHKKAFFLTLFLYGINVFSIHSLLWRIQIFPYGISLALCIRQLCGPFAA